MRVLSIIFLLFGSCFTAPNDSKAGSSIDFDSFVKEDYVIYTAEHDILRILAPMSQFHFKRNLWAESWSVEDTSSSEEKHVEQGPRIVFFVEADIQEGDNLIDQGLYVYKSGKVTKLLDNGRDAIANNENVVYFGASDGIYKYNDAANTAEKHGTVTDNIKRLAFFNFTDTAYYINVNHETFKLNKEATASEKVSEIKDAEGLVFGYDKKIYYYDSAKNVYVYDEINNVAPKKIEGLPAQIGRMALFSPLLGMKEGVILVADKDYFLVSPSGKASKTLLRVEGKPTAYDPAPTLYQFYAKDKKLYELNIPAILKANVASLPEELKQFANAF